MVANYKIAQTIQQTVKTLYPLSPFNSLSTNIKHTAEEKHTHVLRVKQWDACN